MMAVMAVIIRVFMLLVLGCKIVLVAVVLMAVVIIFVMGLVTLRIVVRIVEVFGVIVRYIF
jgi:hypothetical protein